MNNQFVIWRYKTVPGACVPDRLAGVQKKFLLHEGVPLLAGFAGDAAFHMNPDFPNDLLVPDNVRNGALVVLVSERLHRFLADRKVPSVEYLPVKVIDHKGRVASATHVILHPIDLVDCIDREQSVFEPSEFVEGDIDSFKKLVIDPARVPADRQIFKLRGYGELTLVRRELAQALSREAFTGLDWLDVDAFSGR
jgi:hypothetical protein